MSTLRSLSTPRPVHSTVPRNSLPLAIPRFAGIPAVEHPIDRRAVLSEVEQADSTGALRDCERADGRVEGVDADHVSI